MAISGVNRESIGILWVYIGNLAEAVYYPPEPQDVPDLMKNWIMEINTEAFSVKEIFEKIAADSCTV